MLQVDADQKLGDYQSKATGFMASVLPETSLLKKDTFWWDLYQSMLHEHDWLAVWNYPSVYLSRYLRWVGLVTDYMITLFFDTLFYMVYFPNGVCEPLPTMALCLSIPSQIDPSKPQCVWVRHNKTCIMGDPPGNFIFTAMTTILLLCLSYPPSMVMWGFLCETLNMYPDWESYGLPNFFGTGRIGDTAAMRPLEEAALGGVKKIDVDRGLDIEDDQDAEKYAIQLSKHRYLNYITVQEEASHLLKQVH